MLPRTVCLAIACLLFVIDAAAAVPLSIAPRMRGALLRVKDGPSMGIASRLIKSGLWVDSGSKLDEFARLQVTDLSSLRSALNDGLRAAELAETTGLLPDQLIQLEKGLTWMAPVAALLTPDFSDDELLKAIEDHSSEVNNKLQTQLLGSRHLIAQDLPAEKRIDYLRGLDEQIANTEIWIAPKTLALYNHVRAELSPSLLTPAEVADRLLFELSVQWTAPQPAKEIESPEAMPRRLGQIIDSYEAARFHLNRFRTLKKSTLGPEIEREWSIGVKILLRASRDRMTPPSPEEFIEMRGLLRTLAMIYVDWTQDVENAGSRVNSKGKTKVEEFLRTLGTAPASGSKRAPIPLIPFQADKSAFVVKFNKELEQIALNGEDNARRIAEAQSTVTNRIRDILDELPRRWSRALEGGAEKASDLIQTTIKRIRPILQEDPIAMYELPSQSLMVNAAAAVTMRVNNLIGAREIASMLSLFSQQLSEVGGPPPFELDPSVSGAYDSAHGFLGSELMQVAEANAAPAVRLLFEKVRSLSLSQPN